MRLSELQLTERATSVLFHYTNTNAALKILTAGNFELASTTGNRSEEQYAPKDRPFFLSLTRTPQGDYHRYVGTGAVLFKMDGDWFNSRYVVKPIDYWERAWLHSDGTRSREAEDRVFSAEPTIPISSITEVHVLLKEQDEFRSPRTRMLMFVAKKQGLPVFLYTEEAAWRLLDRRRAKSVKDAADVLRGAQVPSGPSRRPTDYVKPWIEMITKDDQAHLSDRAKGLLKTMRYYGRPDEDQNLGVDLSNARKPDAGDRASAVWLIKYMQSNGFNTTLELKNSIEDKWNKIIDAQQQKVTEEPIKLAGTGPAVKTWIEKVYAKYPQTWQNNHVMPLGGEGDDQQFAMFELVPSFSKRGAVEVKWIQAYPLRQGVGGRAMKILQDLAREDGIALTLYPWDKGVVSQSKLMKFYRAQGFAPTSKGAKNMQWDPAVNELKIDNKSGAGSVPYNQDVDYFGLRVAMKPSTFLKLALPLPDDADYEHLKQHIAKGGAVGAPFLDVKIPPEWDDGDFSKPAKVVGHEGRHRMKAALSLEGDEPVETHIFPKGGYRARDLTPEFIKHLNQSLETQAGGRVLSGPLFTVSVNENFTNYQGLRPPKNVPGTNLFPGQDIVGQRVYHCTNSLEAIKKSGGLKPRRDATGEREYGRLSTDEHPFIPVIGIWFSVGKPDWVGKHCVSFVIEPTDQVYVAYANTKGLKPNVVLNPIALDRLTVEGQQGVAEGSDSNLSYQGNCTEDDVIEHIFGDVNNFANMVEEHGDEFAVGDLVVKYDPETDIHSFYYKKRGVAENFADGENPVKFTVSSPDGYQHSFQITLAVHGKHVGHFNFVRSADTDDVNNEAEVEQRWQGQGYGKLLLMKAIDVANNHGLDFQQDIRGITDAQQNVYDSLENAGLIVTPGDGFWFLTPQGEQELNGLNENFADGKNPGRKGLSKRVGVNTKASVSSLRKTAKNSSGEKQRMAHWLANMKAGRAKNNK